LATRLVKKIRIRKKINSSWGLIPRLVVFRSNKFLYAQIVDDHQGKTLVQANTQEKNFEKLKSHKNMDAAKALGQLLGQRATEAKIEKIVFDRNGYNYHGRIQVLADAAREAGLKF